MTNTKLQKLRKFNEARTITVEDGHLCIRRLLSGHYNQADADFIAAFAEAADWLIECVEALEWYANPENYGADKGERAREALKL